MPPPLDQTDIGQFEAKQGRRDQPRTREPSRDALGFRLPEQQPARADASTTLTAIAIGADQRRGLMRSLHPQPAHFGKNFGRGRAAILLNGDLDDRHQLALERAVMPFGPIAQTLHDLIRHILNRKIDRHGSKPSPNDCVT
jgi:hypothetical protein